MLGKGRRVRATALAVTLIAGLVSQLAPARAAGGGDRLTSETIVVGGVPRSYLLFVPGSYDSPGSLHEVAVVFHGFSGSDADMVPFVRPAASAAGMVVAFPQGLGSTVTYPTGASFDAGQCCSAAMWARVDDVGLALALLAALRDRFTPRATVVAGFSNGGMLAWRVACEHAAAVDAVIDASGTEALNAVDCHPDRAITAIAVHGTSDTYVPFDGGVNTEAVAVGDVNGFRPITGVIDEWGGHDRCGERTERRPPGMVVTDWSSCARGASVVLYAVTDMGHRPPSAPWPVDFGNLLVHAV